MEDKTGHARKFVIDWLAAGMSGVVAKTIAGPLERVKIVLQMQSMSIQMEELGIQPYAGTWDCIKRLWKEQGFLSYWRGNGANILRYVPSVGFSFAFNTSYQDLLTDAGFEAVLGNKLELVSGAMAGASTAAVVHPLALCHTCMTFDLGTYSNRKFTGIADCARKVVQADGVLGLYRGLCSAIMGSAVYRSLYFGMFTPSQDCLQEMYGGHLPFLACWMVAQTVTFVASMFAYPWDTTSRLLMGQAFLTTRRFNSSLAAAKYLLEVHGRSGLFQGIIPNALKSASGALVLVFYDELNYHFLQRFLKYETQVTSMRYHQYWRVRDIQSEVKRK